VSPLIHHDSPQAEAFFIHTLASPLWLLNVTRRLTTFCEEDFTSELDTTL
jgi:hypothetical protein